MKRRFGNWSKFSVILILLFFMNSCFHRKVSNTLQNNKETNVLFFLETFEFDRIQIFDNKKKIFDSIINSNTNTRVALVQKFNSKAKIIKFNNDTIFDISSYFGKWNNFIFTKENKVYKLVLAKDTTILSL